jgi:hypothetical protein
MKIMKVMNGRACECDSLHHFMSFMTLMVRRRRAVSAARTGAAYLTKLTNMVRRW